jgi:ABC-type transporter Mla subunit MlaD
VIRRLLFLALTAALVAAVIVLSNGDEDPPPRYTIELDNAFGLVVGGDVRVAGVNAGRVSDIELDERTKKALVEVEITQTGFGSFRSDVFCESKPQSPLGEYFVDCLPGRERKILPEGSRIPVRQTTSTIPPDLITNIMRLPYRERMRLILMEFGAGLAGRPKDLNDAIRRGVPALRQSARVLEILADHNRVIRDLVDDADEVIGELADNRRNVGKFVSEARDTASAAAERADDLATNWRKLPTFLRELRPTLAALGETADEQRPVLVDLNASAGELRRFLDLSGDFSHASRPAFRGLADAAEVGRGTVRAGRPRVAELRGYARPSVDLAENLAIVLEDFDDPRRATEPNPRSPGGRGFSGSQAILQYVFNQTMVLNAFDQLGHMVRSGIFVDHCSPHVDAETYKRDERRLRDCPAWLGPTQPGVTAPDFNVPPRDPQDFNARTQATSEEKPEPGDDTGGDRVRAGERDAEHRDRERRPAAIERLIERLAGDRNGPPAPAPEGAPAPLPLLDYLLAP